MSALKTGKRRAREKALEARQVAFEQSLDEAANGFLQKFFLSQHCQIVAGYMPIKTELSALPTMEWLFEQGKQICVPVVKAEASPLAFAKWTPDTKMIKGAFGAMIPEQEVLLTPDIVVVPLLAYDNSGNRLGYGGGFYDRTLREISISGGVNAVGFAYSAQRVARFPVEKTDYVLDYVVNEKEVLSF